jgi:hypothetical protein
MSIFDFIGGIFKPAADLVDNLHTSTEEKGLLKNKLAEIQAGMQNKVMELEGKIIDAESKVRVAEANSKFFLTAAWRPMCSILLIVLVVGQSTGWYMLDPEVYDLTKILVGGYAVGRSGEKIVNSLKLGK